MNYNTHSTKKIDSSGTSLQGYIDADYQDLKKLFGKPLKGDGYKTDAEWNIEFEDETVATIYNYKDGKNYNGKSGTAKKEIRDWHIGGFSDKSVKLVREIIEKCK